MIDFIYLVPICSFLCLGVHALTRRGNIFGSWSFVVLNEENENRFALADPVSECLLCMSSLYGSLVLALHYGVSAAAVGIVPLIVSILIFISCEIIFNKKEFRFLQKFTYLVTIILFFATALQNNYIESIVFLICVAGANYFVSLLVGLIKSNIERNTIQNENSVNQSEAIETIIEAIKK